MISSRIVWIDGGGVEDLKVKNYPKRLLRSVSVTWSDGAPPGTRVAEGKWWKREEDSGLAVVDRAAERLQLHVGSKVIFEVSERTISSRVGAIYKVDGEHPFTRSEFVLARAARGRSGDLVWGGALCSGRHSGY